MIYLIFSILTTTGILICFKTVKKQGQSVFILIVINYIVATLTGLIVNISKVRYEEIDISSWIYFAIIMGVLFISNFFIMALSTQKAGMSVSSVASKMSVIIPIVFSIVVFNESLDLLKLTGIIIALIALFLSLTKKQGEQKFILKYAYFPIFLFIGSGIIDSLIKFSQASYVQDNNTAIFSASVFGISALCGLIIIFFRFSYFKRFIKPKIIFSGFILGLLNFCALFSIIKALEYSGLDSSLVFLINSVGIVVLSVLTAVIFFHEKLVLMNWIGIVLSIIAIFILTN